MARAFTLLFLFIFALVKGQTTISGTVKSTKGETIVGANIYLENTYEGASTDANGNFSFKTQQSNQQTLVVSSLGFEEQKVTVILSEDNLKLKILLKEAFNQLKAVSITAGSVAASDEARSLILKPLDIVTTAGATGDIVGALQTLPGTAQVGNDGRLFVRGGSANETALFFDGLKVNNAYGSSLSGIPTRTRFNPQLFTGTFFSTGGYSAEYGQALSSVLVLNTVDIPQRTQTDFSAMTVGGAISHTQVWENTSATASLNYLNLTPYQSLVPQNLQWDKAPKGLNSEILLRHKFGKRSLLKVFYANQSSSLSIYQKDPGETENYLVSLTNQFHYGNISYEETWGTKWLLNTGFSYSHNNDDTRLDALDLNREEDLAHAKLAISYFANPKLSFRFGAEHYEQGFSESVSQKSRSIALPLNSGFAEGSYYLNDAIAIKVGVRGEMFQNEMYTMPRISTAWRLAEKHQISAAYGTFFQQQNTTVLVEDAQLAPSKSEHLILNYQFNSDQRIFRVEGYLKNYSNLLTSSQDYQSNGSGIAQGFDVFFRDSKSIHNLDYWLTYSFVDSKRQFGKYTEQVQPGFAPRHNISVVGKYWVSKLHSQLGLSYSINDGYTYDNPNLEGQMESKTKAFNSLSLNWSYLPRPNLIIHIAVNNVLGTQNVFGYRYSETPDAQNLYAEMPMGQAADRFFFIGVFYTLSSDKKANQLNNL